MEFCQSGNVGTNCWFSLFGPKFLGRWKGPTNNIFCLNFLHSEVVEGTKSIAADTS